MTIEGSENQMNPIRILHVVVSMDAGGIETMLMNYYRNIDRTKVQFDFLLHCKHKSHYEDEIIALGGNIYRVPSYHPKELIKYKKALKVFFDQHKVYKVVHSHIKFYGLYVLKAAKTAGVPMRIAHAHTANKFYKLDKTLIFRMYTRFRFKKQYTHVYACSPDAAEYMAPKKPYTIMNNAIDVKDFVFSQEKRGNARKELGLENALVIGHVGRFTDEKNHGFILDVFSKLVKQKNNARLLLIGNGKLWEQMKAKAEALGISDKVIFTGVRKDIGALMSAMDIFVFPSKFEGFPVTLVEAQSADLPCIISDTFTKTAVISDRVKALPLEKGAAFWAEELTKTDASKVRRDNTEMMINAGMDIKSNAEALEKVYLEAYGYGKQ